MGQKLRTCWSKALFIEHRMLPTFFWPGKHFKHKIQFSFYSHNRKQELLMHVPNKEAESQRGVVIGQGPVTSKWQLRNHPKYPRPSALQCSLFSEPMWLPLNCSFKICVTKRSASQWLYLSRWLSRHVCFSAYVLATICEETVVCTKAKPRNTISVFQWADWELGT